MQNPINWLITKLNNKDQAPQSNKVLSVDPSVFSTASPCCNALVHIAYRGVSDDRLYLSYDRKWQEVKFFRPNGLRVYCQKCRQRVL